MKAEDTSISLNALYSSDSDRSHHCVLWWTYCAWLVKSWLRSISSSLAASLASDFNRAEAIRAAPVSRNRIVQVRNDHHGSSKNFSHSCETNKTFLALVTIKATELPMWSFPALHISCANSLLFNRTAHKNKSFSGFLKSEAHFGFFPFVLERDQPETQHDNMTACLWLALVGI